MLVKGALGIFILQAACFQTGTFKEIPYPLEMSIVYSKDDVNIFDIKIKRTITHVADIRYAVQKTKDDPRLRRSFHFL